jgi:ribosomal protein S18 acetylase RimI-like enzyme
VNDPRIRAATLDDADEIARVHVQVWRETYRGVMPDAFLAGLSVEQRAAMWKRVIDESSGAPNVWALENADKAITGFGCIGTSRDERLGAEGEVLAINLLDVVKRRGLGRALFAHLLGLLKQRGFASAGLWVLTANESARRFYEAMDGKAGAIRILDSEPPVLEEISYRWDLGQQR